MKLKIPIKKKDVLMRQKLSLDADLSSVRRGRKNWVEPLRKWILDSKRAGFLATSTKYAEIRDFARSFGTNPALRDKTVFLSFSPPSDFARARLMDFRSERPLPPKAGKILGLSEREVLIGEEILTFALTFFKQKE